MSNFDYGETLPDGQHQRHPTLPKEERMELKRPVRTRYRHLRCGTVTTMPLSIAETYAADPSFYGATFCCGCGRYLPVGMAGEFVWIELDGRELGIKVGT